MKKIINDIFKILIEVFVFNKKLRSKLKARWAKFRLRKYVDLAVLITSPPTFAPSESLRPERGESVSPQALTSSESLRPEREENTSSPIFATSEGDLPLWQYWHQAEIPDIVQKCLASVKKYENEREIHILTFDTIKDYVELPQIYYDLLAEGKMKIAHFSDILRLYLLEKYGGVWIDSTIMLSDKIPQEIIDSDFCVVQKDAKTDDQENKMSCYFIRAKKTSVNLKAIKTALEAYWKENRFLVNYFMFEHISTMLSDATAELKAEWDKMPFISAENCGRLQEIMDKDFTNDEWNEIKSKSFMHKLTYKKEVGEKFREIINK